VKLVAETDQERLAYVPAWVFGAADCQGSNLLFGQSDLDREERDMHAPFVFGAAK
jgi:hypothetical protein